MSGETSTPATETATPAPATASADTSATPAESAAPAADAEDEFIPDPTESKAEPSTEGKADDESKAKPEGEADDFLAETDDDDAEGKADAPGDAKPESAAEAYQPFTLPDGLEVDEATIAEATPLLRKLGADQDGAQELVSFHATKLQQAVQAYHQTLADGHAQRLNDWAKETKAHPEFGGANLKASKAQAAQALALEPAARKVLVEYGLDRNPAVFALLARLGSKLSPDSLVRDDAGSPAKETPKRAADVMYS